jgi:hypothetical protein
MINTIPPELLPTIFRFLIDDDETFKPKLKRKYDCLQHKSIRSHSELYYWLVVLKTVWGYMPGHFGCFYEDNWRNEDLKRIDALKFIWCMDLQGWLHYNSAIYYAVHDDDIESVEFLLDPANGFEFDILDLEICVEEVKADKIRRLLNEAIILKKQ